MPHIPDSSLPEFTNWPSFPFEGDLRVKQLAEPVDVEPPRKGEDAADCTACGAPDDAYIWVSERWRVRAMDRPTGLPMVLILETRSHLDLGDLPNLLAAELGVMTVRLERAVRSLDGVARVHVNRWGDGSAHLHMWFLARPYGMLQLRGTFLSLWDDILPAIPEARWRENLAMVAAWLAEFGGRPLAEPPRIDWKAPSSFQPANDGEADSEAEQEVSVASVESPDDDDAAREEVTPSAIVTGAVADDERADGTGTARYGAGSDEAGASDAGGERDAEPAGGAGVVDSGATASGAIAPDGTASDGTTSSAAPDRATSRGASTPEHADEKVVGARVATASRSRRTSEVR